VLDTLRQDPNEKFLYFGLFGKEGCLNNYVSNTPTKYTYKKWQSNPITSLDRP
jgi:hypothetical protein